LSLETAGEAPHTGDIFELDLVVAEVSGHLLVDDLVGRLERRDRSSWYRIGRHEFKGGFFLLVNVFLSNL